MSGFDPVFGFDTQAPIALPDGAHTHHQPQQPIMDINQANMIIADEMAGHSHGQDLYNLAYQVATGA